MTKHPLLLRSIVGVGFAVLGGCAGDPAQLANPTETLDDIVSALRNFGISNESYYAEHRTFTEALGELQSEFTWAPDSVDLTVRLSDDRQGWAALATHVRAGPDFGCVLAWGAAPPVATPQGVPHDGSNLIVCDQVFDEATNRNGVAPPAGEIGDAP
jgi:hypothetical protein